MGTCYLQPDGGNFEIGVEKNETWLNVLHMLCVHQLGEDVIQFHA